jgi:type IV pilus assembly protein PilE
MNRRNGNRARGLTMIELMIVLVVIAVLVALAYPSYIDYVRKARRGEAQQLLLNWAINQEIFRSNNPAYADDDNANLPKPDHTYYGFLAWEGPAGASDSDCDAPAGSPNAVGYLLRTVATGDQANDKTRDGTSCATLCIAHTGAKSPAACWD